MQHNEISELVDYLVGKEDNVEPKPSPQGLIKAIEKFNADRKNVLYIGDHQIDAKTAEKARVDFVAVLTGETSKVEFEKFPCIFIANNLTEIIDYTAERNL